MKVLIATKNQGKIEGAKRALLTHDKISRIDLTEMAFIMALTEYINDSWR